jgi:hypothetical protein
VVVLRNYVHSPGRVKLARARSAAFAMPASGMRSAGPLANPPYAADLRIIRNQTQPKGPIDIIEQMRQQTK